MRSKLHYIIAITAIILNIASASTHTSNWAVLVSTSRFWFNYRHLANTLSIYRTVKRLGIPDSQIILMLPDDMACNPRNSFAGSVFNDKSRELDLYDDTTGDQGMSGIEVDYRGYEVTVENFIRLLTDRWPAGYPRSKRLLTDERSNILIYMTGHGGNEFLKFQDAEEISSFDLADAFEQMWEKKRYNELLFMVDSCQANTMYEAFYSPNIVATGSAALDQNSYSHHSDLDVGVAVIDRWTYYNLEFLEDYVNTSTSDNNVTLGQLFDSYDPAKIHGDAGVRYDLFHGGEQEARGRKIVDFFGNVQGVEVDHGNSNRHRDMDDFNADLRAMRKMLERQQRVMEGDRRTNRTTTAAAVAPTSDTTRAGATTTTAAFSARAQRDTIGSVNTLDQGPSWSRKAVGAAILLTLGVMWGMGSFLDT